ncbi:MAG: hypothetical protein V7739_19495 [Motiliproteus sp.]
MTDDSAPDIFNEGVVKKSPGSIYMLTSVRQLLRMLDIGLVVPELVACVDDAIAAFDIDQLPALSTMAGYPAVPVLLELKLGVTKPQSVYPASAIKTIHFASQDELEDYQARGFENVPNTLFDFEVTPALFDKSSQGSVAASLAKIDRSALRRNYRQYDVLAGLLWDAIAQAGDADDVGSLLHRLASYSAADDVPAALNDWIQYKAEAGKLPLEDSGLMSTYLHLLGERDLDEGWASADVLEELAGQVLAPVADSEAFQKWYRYSKAVINNEKELGTLTDDGDVLLRAILLHLLNPDAEAIERMALRDPAPGIKVLAMARTLAATRLGFAPLSATGKLERPGAFWLVSDLIGAFINRDAFELNELVSESDPANGLVLSWQGQWVNNYAVIPSQSGSTGVGIRVDADVDEGGIQQEAPAYLSLIELQQMAERLDAIANTTIDEGQLTLVLTNPAAKLLPKQAVFSISMQGEQGVTFTSRLLDLSMKSHKAKLTGKRTLAALVYQTEQGADFRFEAEEEKYFSAQITLPQEINQQSLQTALQRLLDCHAWMKTTIK